MEIILKTKKARPENSGRALINFNIIAFEIKKGYFKGLKITKS